MYRGRPSYYFFIVMITILFLFTGCSAKISGQVSEESISKIAEMEYTFANKKLSFSRIPLGIGATLVIIGIAISLLQTESISIPYLKMVLEAFQIEGVGLPVGIILVLVGAIILALGIMLALVANPDLKVEDTKADSKRKRLKPSESHKRRNSKNN